MSESLAGVLFVTSLAVALVVVHRPLGDLLFGWRPRRGTWRRSGLRIGLLGQIRRASSPGVCTRAACWRSRRSQSCFSTVFFGCKAIFRSA